MQQSSTLPVFNNRFMFASLWPQKCNRISCSVICHVSAYSLFDWLLVIGGHVDDLVAFLPQDVQHTVVPQEVTWQRTEHEKSGEIKNVSFLPCILSVWLNKTWCCFVKKKKNLLMLITSTWYYHALFLAAHYSQTVPTACYSENKCLLFTRPVVLTICTMVLPSHMYNLTDVTNLLILSQTFPEPKQNQVSLILKPKQTLLVVKECNHTFDVAFVAVGVCFLNNVLLHKWAYGPDLWTVGASG